MMYAIIRKWGNSCALRIPKPLLDALSIQENDRVELIQADDEIVIRKAVAPSHQTLEQRLTAFYGKPVDEIAPLQSEEIDWGRAEGGEVW